MNNPGVEIEQSKSDTIDSSGPPEKVGKTRFLRFAPLATTKLFCYCHCEAQSAEAISFLENLLQKPGKT